MHFFLWLYCALLRTFAAAVEESAACVRQMLALDKINESNIGGLYWLADEIKPLFVYDPQLAEDLYLFMFSANEPPDTRFPMGTSQIVNLVSTVRQDFRMAKHSLGEAFVGFLDASLEHAIRTLCRVVDMYVRDKAVYRTEPQAHEFSFRGQKASILADGSSIWDDRDLHEHDPAVIMINAFQQYLETHVGEESFADYIVRTLDTLTIHNRSAVLWRRLLRFAALHPREMATFITPLIKVPAILACSDTRVDAGRFLKVAYPFIDQSHRSEIEQSIMGIPASNVINALEYGERVRDRLLGCLSMELLATQSAQARLLAMKEANEVPDNEPDVRDRVGPDGCPPGPPTDPYVHTLVHTVPRITDSLRGCRLNGRPARELADTAGEGDGTRSRSACGCGCDD